MSITVSNFEMARPIVQPFNLPDQAAQSAIDCYAHSTGLDVLRSGRHIAAGFGDCQTLYRIQNEFISIAHSLSIARSPIIRDTYQRLYFTLDDTGGLYSSTEQAFSKAEIAGRSLSDFKPPQHAPATMLLENGEPKLVYSQSTIDRIESGELAKRSPYGYLSQQSMDKFASFRVTFVTDQGEESAPSYASETQGYIDDSAYGIRLSNLPVSTYPHVTKRRIYMSVDGDYYLIAEISALGTSHDLDPLNDDRITELLSTEDYDPAPEGLRGLVALPNGSLAGFLVDGETSTICVSEPYQPHAWPVAYRWKTRYPVVALASVPEGLLVLPRGVPQLIAGATPDVMTAHDIENGEGCESARSVIVVDGVCYWACPDGIAAFGAGRAGVVSRGTWSRDQWQALQPDRMLLGWYEGHLLIYSEQSAFIYSLSRNDMSQLSEGGVTALFMDLHRDAVFVVREGALYAFNQGDGLTATWRSKDYVLPQARSQSCGRVEADGYPLTLRFLMEGEQYFEKVITDNKPFRLRSSGRKRYWCVEAESQYRVRLMQFASSMRGIM